MSKDNTLQPEQMGMEPELEREEVQVESTGEQQMQARYAAGIACPKCGAMNDAEALFCSSCGQSLHQMACPNCGAPVDEDADFCETCHHYIRKGVCSFCGADINEQDGFCPECGLSRGSLTCPACHTVNDFSFCKQGGRPLTEEAKTLQHQLRSLPEYHELMKLASEYNELQMQLPYASEQDKERDEASQRLRERIMRLLAEDGGVENPVIKPSAHRRCSLEELNANKQRKMEQLAALLDRMALPPMAAPVKARNYAMAQKPAGMRLAWMCNYKNALHSSPCGCAKPQMGGKWIVLGHNSNQEIKDDK